MLPNFSQNCVTSSGIEEYYEVTDRIAETIWQEHENPNKDPIHQNI